MQFNIINHEVTEMMFKNNKDFYDDVVSKGFDIRLFRRSLKSAENRVAFLAFGKIFEKDVIRLLAKWVPNYRARFWWFVVKRHIFKKSYEKFIPNANYGLVTAIPREDMTFGVFKRKGNRDIEK